MGLDESIVTYERKLRTCRRDKANQSRTEYSDRGEIVERKLWISRCRWRKVQGVVTGLLSWAEARRLKMRFVGLRNVDVNYWDLDNASSVGVLDYGG